MWSPPVRRHLFSHHTLHTLQFTILNGPVCAAFHVHLCIPVPWPVGAHIWISFRHSSLEVEKGCELKIKALLNLWFIARMFKIKNKIITYHNNMVVYFNLSTNLFNYSVKSANSEHLKLHNFKPFRKTFYKTGNLQN